MKRNDVLSALLDGALAWLLAIAGAGCLMTAFSFDADMAAVAWTAAVCALLAVLCARLRWGWILLVLTALGGLWLLNWLDFESNLYSALNRILDLYNRGYGWPIPEFVQGYDDWDVTLTFQVMAAVCTLLAGITLSKNALPLAVLAALLPIFPCMVITDTVPSENFLLPAMVAVALIALTGHARCTDTRQANRLTALLLIPLLLAGMLLFVRVPQSEYVEPDANKGIFAFVNKLEKYFPFFAKSPVVPQEGGGSKVDLSTLGPRAGNYTKVMEVTSSIGGTVYIRTISYGAYTGTSWQTLEEEMVIDPPDPKCVGQSPYAVNIKTYETHPWRYVPWYPGDAITLTNGMVANDGADSYIYRVAPVNTNSLQTLWKYHYGKLTVGNINYFALSHYTDLPEETATRASQYLQKAGIHTGDDVFTVVQKVTDYVKNTAQYNKYTQVMPATEQDFALWFLEAGETGYCVHFATAATVLLRAAGIPARYVEGYLVKTTAQQTTVVRGERAHAWVEYYVPHVGWVILEATPSEGLVPDEPPATTVPPPTTTTAPTEPTMPTVPVTTPPTQPGPTTGPTAPTTPTEPPTTAPATRPTTPPATLPGSDQEPHRDMTWLKEILLWLGRILAGLALLVGQWQLRLRLRRKAMTGFAFRAVRRRWRYSCLLAWLCRHKAPNFLLELLKKAKYSRNGLNDRDLRQFERYWAACVRGLGRKNWLVRLFCRLILAAW